MAIVEAAFAAVAIATVTVSTDKFNAFVKKVDTALITQNQAIKGLEQTTKENEKKLQNLNNDVSSLREDIQNLLLKKTLQYLR